MRIQLIIYLVITLFQSLLCDCTEEVNYISLDDGETKPAGNRAKDGEEYYTNRMYIQLKTVLSHQQNNISSRNNKYFMFFLARIRKNSCITEKPQGREKHF